MKSAIDRRNNGLMDGGLFLTSQARCQPVGTLMFQELMGCTASRQKQDPRYSLLMRKVEVNYLPRFVWKRHDKIFPNLVTMQYRCVKSVYVAVSLRQARSEHIEQSSARI